eukprot:6193893-Pleurochrysis_carterae.AAC.1
MHGCEFCVDAWCIRVVQQRGVLACWHLLTVSKRTSETHARTLMHMSMRWRCVRVRVCVACVCACACVRVNGVCASSLGDPLFAHRACRCSLGAHVTCPGLVTPVRLMETWWPSRCEIVVSKPRSAARSGIVCGAV